MDPARPLAARLSLALDAAHEAAALTLRYFRRGVGAEAKADGSPVTIADREAEQLIRRRIGAAFAGDAILGEEFGEQPGASGAGGGAGGWRWILDPIDGTKSFVRGVPLYGTMIGVERDGEPVIGVIALPGLGETVYASRGGGAFVTRGGAEGRPEPARVSSVASLGEGLFCTTSFSRFSKRERFDVVAGLCGAAKLSRGWGDCYGHVLVATGRAEAMVDTGQKVWDAAPLLPIIEEAGGRFTDWQGRATIHGGDGISTNGRVHDEVLRFTRGR